MWIPLNCNFSDDRVRRGPGAVGAAAAKASAAVAEAGAGVLARWGRGASGPGRGRGGWGRGLGGAGRTWERRVRETRPARVETERL